MLKQEWEKTKVPVGLNLESFEVLSPEKMGIYDNFSVK